MSGMSKEYTTHCRNCGLRIGGCRMCLSMATGSRYMTKYQQSVMVEVEEVIWVWHT